MPLSFIVFIQPTMDFHCALLVSSDINKLYCFCQIFISRLSSYYQNIEIKMPGSKARKSLTSFIKEIRDEKLVALPEKGGHRTLVMSRNFRLDRQCVTSVDPRHQNLQIQVNSQSRIRQLRGLIGKSVTKALVPIDGSWSPQRIREELRRNIAPRL
jgi:hypothetical protein